METLLNDTQLISESNTLENAKDSTLLFQDKSFQEQDDLFDFWGHEHLVAKALESELALNRLVGVLQ